jgi:type IX secretion system PorP/SprF family membrane protein
MVHFKKILLTLFIILSAGIAAFSQDPHFSQYYANPIYLNPAFAGTAVCPRVILNYRNQWPSISGTFVTYSASYDQHFDALAGGVGVSFVSDQAGEGTLTTYMASAIYSYRLQVNRFFSIKAGFQASYFQKSIDWEKLTFGDQIDPRYGFVYYTAETKPNNLTKGTTDFSAGLLGYGESIYGGVAVFHLTQPNEGFFSVSKLPMRIVGHIGGIIDLQHHRRRRKIEDPTLSPNLLFMKQQDFEQMNYGLYLNKYPLIGGLWFRQGFQNPDAFIALIGLQTSVVKIGYSYDVTVSKLSNATGGSHEVSFALQFPCHQKKKRIRAINCPSF